MKLWTSIFGEIPLQCPPPLNNSRHFFSTEGALRRLMTKYPLTFLLKLRRLLTKYPLFLLKFLVSRQFWIHFKGHTSNLNRKSRKSSWTRKIVISDPVHAVLSRIKFSHQLPVRRGGGSWKMMWWQWGGEGESGYPPKVMASFMNGP